MNLEEKRSVVDCYVHAFNSFDVEAMISVLQPEITYTCISNGKTVYAVNGIEEFRDLGGLWKNLFSSRKLTIMELYEKGNQIIMEISCSTVMATQSTGGLKAGETLIQEGVSEMSFRDDKILSITEIF